MLKKYLLTLAAVVATTLGMSAQLVYSSPKPLQQTSSDVYVYYDSSLGNLGLKDLPDDCSVYAHTGVITNKSTGSSDWKYAPSWGDNSEKYKLERIEKNLWRLKIGDIDAYYGVPADIVVEQLAFVFRGVDAKGAAKGEGKTAGNSDIFLPVLPAGLQIQIDTDMATPTLLKPQLVKFTISATENADISLFVNEELIGNRQNTKTYEVEYTISDPGNYKFRAEAVNGSETAMAEYSCKMLTPSKQVDYPGGVPKMGAVRNDDGSVTFCVAAPYKTLVNLLGQWNSYQITSNNAMNYQDYEGARYFWLTVQNLRDDLPYPYYFLVDGNTAVGDPYAKLILDPGMDNYISKDVFPDLPAYPTTFVKNNVPLAIYQGNINDYDWKVTDFKRPAKKDLVIYELLFRDFTGANGKANGSGTVKKAMEKIPYLKSLGVNAIELLPIMEFNGNNSWGYNTNFYFAPDKAYGTPDDYKEFIDKCHEEGMAVILDIVFNQTDGKHPWYQMYPIAQNPFYNMYSVNGSPGAPHAYSVLNDWKQENPLVRQQFKDAVKYWLTEYNVDGFRFDLVKGLGDSDSYGSTYDPLTNSWSNNDIDNCTNRYNGTRVTNMHDIQLAMEEVDPEAYFINENLAGAKEENEMAAFGMLNWANLNHAGIQFASGYNTNSDLNPMYSVYDGRTLNSTVAYLESHDEERLAYAQETSGAYSLRKNKPARMQRLGCAAAQMILVPGAHMIWQFSEMGNAQTTKKGGQDTSPKIVPWNELEDPYQDALMKTYAKLIETRLANADVFDTANGAQFQMSCNSNNWKNGRTIYSTKDDKQIVTVINPNINGDPITVNLNLVQDPSKYYMIVKSYGAKPVFNKEDKTMTVPANAFITIGTDNLTAVESVVAENSGDAEVYGANGAIVVAAPYEHVAVYDLAGANVYSGKAAANTTIDVAPGIYLVRADGKSAKIMVK